MRPAFGPARPFVAIDAPRPGSCCWSGASNLMLTSLRRQRTLRQPRLSSVMPEPLAMRVDGRWTYARPASSRSSDGSLVAQLSCRCRRASARRASRASGQVLCSWPTGRRVRCSEVASGASLLQEATTALLACWCSWARLVILPGLPLWPCCPPLFGLWRPISTSSSSAARWPR